MPGHPKIVSVLCFAVVVVATPITAWTAFVAFLTILIAHAFAAKLPLRTYLARAVIEVPFVLFAVLMPLAGTGRTWTVGPLVLHETGLLAGASILAKGTLGVLAAVLLSTTTTAREVLRGLATLRLPSLMVQIASFMLRYINVVNDEMERMRVAREARSFHAKGMADWRIIAITAGALFIRSYERGERVHLAMLSRGYNGTLPDTDRQAVTPRQWAIALLLPGAALLAHVIGRSL